MSTLVSNTHKQTTQSREHLSAYLWPSAGHEPLSGRKHKPDCKPHGWLLSLRSAFWRTPEGRSSETLSLLWTAHRLASSLTPLDWQGWVLGDSHLLERNTDDKKSICQFNYCLLLLALIPAVVKNGDDNWRSLSLFLTKQRSHFRSWKSSK